MNKLVWELFLMLREVMPATAENTRRFNDWAAKFHAVAGEPNERITTQAPVAHDDIAEHPTPPLLSQPAEERDIDEEDDGDGAPADEHPAAHAARHSAGKRKKK